MKKNKNLWALIIKSSGDWSSYKGQIYRVVDITKTITCLDTRHTKVKRFTWWKKNELKLLREI